LLADAAERKLSGVGRTQIGFVQQEPVLFAGTVRENILYGAQEGTTDDDVQRAAELANAHGFIMELAEGYATQVGGRPRCKKWRIVTEREREREREREWSCWAHGRWKRRCHQNHPRGDQLLSFQSNTIPSRP
jgi:hypothetical protein